LGCVMDLDNLLLGEKEFANADTTDVEKLLYRCLVKIEAGEPAIGVATWAIESGLTGQQVRHFLKWLKKARPNRRKRTIDAVKRRGV